MFPAGAREYHAAAGLGQEWPALAHRSPQRNESSARAYRGIPDSRNVPLMLNGTALACSAPAALGRIARDVREP
jgi:hypothetical protein